LSGSDLLGSGLLLGDTHPVRLHVIHGFDFTETNALRISITQITLEILSIDDIKIHGTERADRYAGTAANADIVIHHHPTEFFISGNGLHGADDHAGSILTLLAGHGNVEPF
jgi:hypothetical protein